MQMSRNAHLDLLYIQHFSGMQARTIEKHVIKCPTSKLGTEHFFLSLSTLGEFALSRGYSEENSAHGAFPPVPSGESSPKKSASIGPKHWGASLNL